MGQTNRSKSWSVAPNFPNSFRNGRSNLGRLPSDRLGTNRPFPLRRKQNLALDQYDERVILPCRKFINKGNYLFNTQNNNRPTFLRAKEENVQCTKDLKLLLDRQIAKTFTLIQIRSKRPVFIFTQIRYDRIYVHN